jgi:hypothetical protein
VAKRKKQSALSIPIFQDPPEGIEEDWSGFLIGGMAQSGDMELARAFKQAGDAVVGKALRSSDLSYEFSYPALYLYRHAIELYLKLVVDPKKRDHRIDELASEFQSMVRTKLKQEVPNWVMERIRELADIDPNSFSFRYTKDRRGRRMMLPGEFWVSFRHLRRVVNVLATGLENAYFTLGKS